MLHNSFELSQSVSDHRGDLTLAAPIILLDSFLTFFASVFGTKIHDDHDNFIDNPIDNLFEAKVKIL